LAPEVISGSVVSFGTVVFPAPGTLQEVSKRVKAIVAATSVFFNSIPPVPDENDLEKPDIADSLTHRRSYIN
jgi:hypothetical protein